MRDEGEDIYRDIHHGGKLVIYVLLNCNSIDSMNRFYFDSFCGFIFIAALTN